MMIFMLLASWIFLTISATCSMPSVFMAMTEPMPECLETDSHAPGHHQGQMPVAKQDCSLKPCFESQPNPFSGFNRLVKPDLPVFIVFLIWTFGGLFFVTLLVPIPRVADSPPGRRIPLIYRFCTLLN
jgi:hypothetical protein